jgi:uncharacterized protein YukE
MTTIRVKPEELETVAKHVPDAEDACQRVQESLSWTLPSLAMEIPGIGSAAIHELKDELIHWLRRYEEKLNEAEELLYRTAAAMRQADQTLAENMKEFGLELLGWYDLQRLFGEYDPITGERISGWDRLLAGGMLLASFIPLIKGIGIAGKVGIKGAKSAGITADVSNGSQKRKTSSIMIKSNRSSKRSITKSSKNQSPKLSVVQKTMEELSSSSEKYERDIITKRNG